MSVEQLEAQVLALPLAGRRAFPRWLDDHRDGTEQTSQVVAAQGREVRRRLLEMEAGPGLRVSGRGVETLRNLLPEQFSRPLFLVAPALMSAPVVRLLGLSLPGKQPLPALQTVAD